MPETALYDTIDIERIRKSPLFNAAWYVETYPDVFILGMDPAEHYLKYGALLRRDPGPEFCGGYYQDTRIRTKSAEVGNRNQNPLLHHIAEGESALINVKNVIWAAEKVFALGEEDKAIRLAENDLSGDLRHPTKILRANCALARGQEKIWLQNLNDYLERFDIAPVTLSVNGLLLDRLTTAPLRPLTGGPLVSVIMPAWNSKATVRAAARSILDQTWRNVELLIVDDASNDGTWTVLQELAAADDRVKIRRNKVNVGPFVSKNFALRDAAGEWITGQDADDWSHPQRLEKHLKEVLKPGRNIEASLTFMLRIRPNGMLSTIGKVNAFSPDGVSRKASISCLFQRQVMSEVLGFWDTVRFGGDSEMIARAEAKLADRYQEFFTIGMLCLDIETSLTNDATHGVRSNSGGLAESRLQYKNSVRDWLKDNSPRESVFLPFPQKTFRYSAPEAMRVPNNDIERNLDAFAG